MQNFFEKPLAMYFRWWYNVRSNRTWRKNTMRNIHTAAYFCFSYYYFFSLKK